jgi:hypothetical protein
MMSLCDRLQYKYTPLFSEHGVEFSHLRACTIRAFHHNIGSIVDFFSKAKKFAFNPKIDSILL